MPKKMKEVLPFNKVIIVATYTDCVSEILYSGVRTNT